MKKLTNIKLRRIMTKEKGKTNCSSLGSPSLLARPLASIVGSINQFNMQWHKRKKQW